MPGGYDFSLPLYYQRIGGTGFAYGAAKPADLGPPPLSVRLLQPLAALRDLIRVRVEAALPGENGHIAAALIMGDQRGISPTPRRMPCAPPASATSSRSPACIWRWSQAPCSG